MLIISKVPPRFSGHDDEQITVQISVNTGPLLATPVLDGQVQTLQGGSFSFQLDQANPNRLLTLQLGFQPPDGTAVYTVSIQGDPAEFQFTDNFDAKFGTEVLEKAFNFSVQ